MWQPIPWQQRQNMLVYGTSFLYGGWESAGIDVAMGMMEGSNLRIAGVHWYDNPTELAASIAGSASPWALDFPFALPGDVYPAFSLGDWEALLVFVHAHAKPAVEEYLRMVGLHGTRERCWRPGGGCRHTDALSGAFSPLMRHGPDRLGTTYEGLKMLGVLRREGVSVYPFDEPGRDSVRVYEVSPWNTRVQLGLGKRAWPRDFVEAFNGHGRRAVEVSPLEDLPTQYDLDAVVSCATLANAIRAYDLEDRWHEMPPWATAQEWQARQKEGLIVRL